MDIMVDIETWATTPDAVIRAVAIVPFDRASGELFKPMLIDMRATVDEQIERGRVIDQSTVDWWRKKKPSLSAMLACYEHNMVYRQTGSVGSAIAWMLMAPWADTMSVWQRRDFDLGILANLLSESGHSAPWEYWHCRDVATLDLLTSKIEPDAPHDPLSDAEAQIRQVQEAIRLAEAGRAFLSGSKAA